jgi:hypothetical protein
MNFAPLTSVFGGSLLTLATLTAAPASTGPESGRAVARDSSNPSAMLSRNLDVAPPEAAHFIPFNGYTGDLTLLGRPQTARKVPAAVIPPQVVPVEQLRFDQKLPELKIMVPLLNTFTPIGGKINFESGTEKKRDAVRVLSGDHPDLAQRLVGGDSGGRAEIEGAKRGIRLRDRQALLSSDLLVEPGGRP